jgi:hypothetical protein
VSIPSSLPQRADLLLRSAIEALPAGPDTHRARLLLADQVAKLRAPLRIALVGASDSGKSTLANALMRAPVAVTGKGPITMAVTILRYAAESSWTVHYEDGQTEAIPSMEKLAAFTARPKDAGAGSAAAGVRFVEVAGQYPELLRYELVDTPGFDSVHPEDTVTALRAIGATQDSADVIIAVLNHAMSGTDAGVLRRFHSAGGDSFMPTALTSMAVLTKVEDYWPGAENPLADAGKNASLVEKPDGGAGRVFHRVLPLLTKVAEAAVLLDGEDFAALRELAAAPRLEERLRAGGPTFARAEDLPLSRDQRRRLYELLCGYGVWLACQLIGAGVNTLPDLRQELDKRSGLRELRRELDERFARHSGLIKVARVVQVAHAVAGMIPASFSEHDRDVAAHALSAITSLADSDPAFAEFEVLRRHYLGELGVSREAGAELEQVVGEHGLTVAQRLGQPDGTPAAELEGTALARARAWSRPHPGARLLARVMKRQYEELYVRVREARAALGDVPQFDRETPAGLERPAPAPTSGAMRDGPVLVVDLGTTTSAAILVDGGQQVVIRDSVHEVWPTVVCERDGALLVGEAARASHGDSPLVTEFKPDIGSPVPVMHGATGSLTAGELAAEVLRALREAATAQQAGSFSSSEPPRRLLLTTPAKADEHWRDALIAAGLRAGFTEVELLPEPVAAAYSVRGPWPPGSKVLVYDLGGGTFDAALIQVTGASFRVLGTAGLADGHGGRDIDAAVFQHIWPATESWLSARPHFMSHQDEVEADVLAAATKLKEGLASGKTAREKITLDHWAELTAAELAPLAGDLVRDTADCCLNLIADAGLEPGDVTAVLLVGGSTRLQLVAPCVEQRLQAHGKVGTAPDPVLAVVQGAARWAADRDLRRLREAYTDPPSRSTVPLTWSLPQSGTLVRWLAERNQVYPPGAPLARVRLDDGSFYDLRARAAGRVVEHHAWPGTRVYSGSWLVTSARPAVPGDVAQAPSLARSWKAPANALAVSPDGRRLAAVIQEPPAVVIIDTVTGTQLGRWDGEDRVTCLTWTHGDGPVAGLAHDDGSFGASALSDETAGTKLIPRMLSRHPAAVLGAAYLAEGREIVTLDGNGTIRITDVRTGLAWPAAEVTGHPTVLAVGSDGQRIAAAGGDAVEGFVHLLGRVGGDGPWDVVKTERPDGRVRAMSFSGERLLLGGDPFAGTPAKSPGNAVPPDLTRPLWAGMPAGRPVRTISGAPFTSLYAAAADRRVWVGDAADPAMELPVADAARVTAVAIAPDGHWLYTAGPDGIKQWALTGSTTPGAEAGEPEGEVSHGT